MGYNNQAPIMALMGLTLFAAAAQAQLLSGLNVTGVFNCPSSGPGLPVGPAIPGVTVSLNCTNFLGATVTLGQGVTGVDGRFNITVRNLLQRLPLFSGSLFPCRVVARLPINQTVCPILSTANGFVSAFPTLLTTVVNSVTGLLFGIFTTGPLVIMTS